MLVKAMKLLCQSTLIAVCNSFIYSYLLYGIEVRDKVSNCYIYSIFKVQKRVIRITASVNYREHTGPLFLSIKVLLLHTIYISAVSMLMHRYSYGCMAVCPQSSRIFSLAIIRFTRNLKELSENSCTAM